MKKAGCEMNHAHDRAERIVSLTEKLEPKEIREVFMTLWRSSDGLNEGLTADDCIEIFASALKGSSDFTYDLLKDTFDDYDVGTITETFALLPREAYEQLFSECLKEEIPDVAELDTEAMTNLLSWQNVGSLDVILLNVAKEEQFSLCFDGKYIYKIDKYGKEIQTLADDFKKKYIGSRWKIATVIAR